MVELSSLSAKELAALALAVGLFSAKLLNAGELNVVGNLVVAIGGIMLTIAAQQQYLESQTKPNANKTIAELQQQVKELTQTVKVLTGDAAK